MKENLELSCNKDISITDIWKAMDIYNASYEGNISLIKELIKDGGNVNLTNNGNTSLMNVSFFGNTEIVNILLESGANVNAYNSKRNTALINASRVGNTEIVRILLESGADVNKIDNRGSTALILASQHARYIKTVKELLQHKNTNIYIKNYQGWTALKYASHRDNKEIVTLIKKRMIKDFEFLLPHDIMTLIINNY